MVEQRKLAALQARKELLILQADAERQLIALDAQQLAHSLRWLELVYAGWQRVKPLAWMAAPVMGFFAARHGRSFWRRGLGLFQMWQSVRGLLRL